MSPNEDYIEMRELLSKGSCPRYSTFNPVCSGQGERSRAEPHQDLTPAQDFDSARNPGRELSFYQPTHIYRHVRLSAGSNNRSYLFSWVGMYSQTASFAQEWLSLYLYIIHHH